MTSYRFRIGPIIFIVNIQYSQLGFSYPRIFIRWPDDSYTNLDLTISACFKMTAEEWNSWLDDELIDLDDIEEVHEALKDTRINIDALIEWAFKQI